jgi:hypothetical protein
MMLIGDQPLSYLSCRDIAIAAQQAPCVQKCQLSAVSWPKLPCFNQLPIPAKTSRWRTLMKSFVMMIVALGFAVSIAAPTFAADAPKDKDSCEKAGMVWDDATKTCKPKE